MGDNKNLIFAIGISAAMILGFTMLFPSEREQGKEKDAQKIERTAQISEKAGNGASDGGKGEKAIPFTVPPKEVAKALEESGPRIAVETPSLQGSIALRGAVLDHMLLKNYREGKDDKSPRVTLLSPKGTAMPYYTCVQWSSPEGALDRIGGLPGPNTVWTSDRDVLRPNEPVTLSWTNPMGVVFEQVISVDNDFLFTVDARVKNAGTQPFSLRLESVAQREDIPYALQVVDSSEKAESSGSLQKRSASFSSHEGPVGFLQGKLREISYQKVLGQETTFEVGDSERGSGWLGFGDKYWLVALIPSPGQKAVAQFSAEKTAEGGIVYRAKSASVVHQVAAGEVFQTSLHVFAGAKQLDLLDRYERERKICHLDLAVDFGWLYFLTKPMFSFLSWLKTWSGGFGIALLILTVLVKLLFLPLSLKSTRAGIKQKELMPKIEALKERFKDDKMRFRQELHDLYKRENANFLTAGCLPQLVQIPVFFALYKVLVVSIEMRHAPFFGWISDLSAPDPFLLVNLFGLLPFTPPDFLAIGAWPLILGVTMFLQQRLGSTPVSDPTQRIMFNYGMPIMFTYMMARLPVGVVIYWTWSNVLAILQQWVVSRYFITPPGAAQGSSKSTSWKGKKR